MESCATANAKKGAATDESRSSRPQKEGNPAVFCLMRAKTHEAAGKQTGIERFQS